MKPYDRTTMRIAIAEVSQESGSFLPEATTLDRFRRGVFLFGEEMEAELRDGARELGGAAREARARGAELVPLLAAQAFAWGPLTASARAFFATELRDRLREAGEVDGVLLVLHGALIAEDEDDVDGHLLRVVRGVVGPAVPVAATVDPHCNLTAQMVANADVIVGYATIPHVDQAETGAKAAGLLVDAVAGVVKPVLAYRKLPMITPADTHATDRLPMKSLADARSAIESSAGILSCTLCAAQPWLDVPELGWASLVVADGDRELGQAKADELARAAWAARRSFLVEKLTPQQAVAECLAAPEGPIVVSDSGDSPGGGGAGDSTTLLAAVLEVDPIPSALLAITDPAGARAAAASGVGAWVDLQVGASIDPTASRPVGVCGQVRALPSGRLTIRGRSWTGSPIDLGTTAIVDVGPLTIVLSEHGLYSIDPDLYRQLGVEPADYRIVQARSETAWEAAYAGLAKGSVRMRSPGATTSDFELLPWRRVERPIFPLDDLAGDVVTLSRFRGGGRPAR
jgi:microcystin degradation protein MlrC